MISWSQLSTTLRITSRLSGWNDSTPFDSRKYRRIHDALIVRGLRSDRDFIRPEIVSWVDLPRVHAAEYLKSLEDPEVLARILEVPQAKRLPGPIFSGRDSVSKDTMAEIEPERRNGYAWYGAWGTRVEENYNGWKANRAKAETPKTGEKS